MLGTPSELLSLTTEAGDRSLAFDPQFGSRTRRLVASGGDNGVNIWDLDTNERRTGKLEAGKGRGIAVAWVRCLDRRAIADFSVLTSIIPLLVIPFL